ncbi:MAG: L-histidine N(alpha)-methyltransferase [Polyangiaceae bacterium]|nr:L-histidine N(alpha)-methyltransferase [Polyangiaceae bacterium]
MRPRSLRVFDLHPTGSDFEAEVVEGLAKPQKTLPCKYFYDADGAQLFEAICATQEYYLTRTERRIFKEHLPDIAKRVGPRAMVIEPGSGSGVKTRMLLEALESPAAYVPVDLSRTQLLVTSAEIAGALPDLEVLPVCADYSQPFPLPGPMSGSGRRLVFYPGSTIGNFDRPEATQFLKRMAEEAGPGGGLLIGFDLKKDPTVLHAAYNDSHGLTARFNKNLLVRIAKHCDTDLELDNFAHYAFYNPAHGRVEMHLVAVRDHTVRIKEHKFVFNAGESIWTESSYKYTRAEVRGLATRAGLEVAAEYVDDKNWFLVALFNVKAAPAG